MTEKNGEGGNPPAVPTPVADLKRLLDQVDNAEVDADGLRWQAAEAIVQQLDAGMTQSELARQVERNQSTVSRYARVWREHGEYAYRHNPLSFHEAWQAVQKTPDPNRKPGSRGRPKGLTNEQKHIILENFHEFGGAMTMGEVSAACGFTTARKGGSSTVSAFINAERARREERVRPDAVVNRAERVIEDIADPEVRNEVRAQLTDRKELRQAEATLRAAEKEVEAARLAEEQREADKEKERLRMVEISRRQTDKSIKTWDKLISEIHASWVVIGAYIKIFDHLPPLHPSFGGLLDNELAELRRQMGWLDKRLHPNGHNTVTRGDFIDI